MARLILFDIDQTLVRTKGAGVRAMRVALEELYGTSSALDGVHIDGSTDYLIFREALERAGRDPEGEYGAFAAAYLRHLPSTLARTPDTEVLPGVVSLLDALSSTHPHVGLGTGNMQAGAKLKLDHFGLWDRFAAGGFGDLAGVRAELISDGIRELAAIAGIPARADDCIILGDTPRDIDAAHAVGARALGVATGTYSVEALRSKGADWAVPDLSDTDAVVRILRL